jgi:hypothetical protein
VHLESKNTLELKANPYLIAGVKPTKPQAVITDKSANRYGLNRPGTDETNIFREGRF